MEIFVVSRSRFNRSDTLERLGEFANQCILVVPNRQVKNYRSLAARYDCNLIGCPKDGIALTRQFCGNLCKSGKFLMLDDDLKFYRRVSKSDWHLKYPGDLGITVQGMLKQVESLLDNYAHVAISAREGNNRLPYPGVECSRPLRALAYRREEFLRVSHGRVAIMEDFDVTMQLLRMGYKNFILSYWSQGQITTQMEGGCSDYRTHELHAENVRRFAELHQGFVRLREKKNRSGGEFGFRLEATIYWQRAWESSQDNKKPQPKLG